MPWRFVVNLSTDFKTKFLRMSSTSDIAGMPECVVQKQFGGTYFTMGLKYCASAHNDPYSLWMGSLGGDINSVTLGSSSADAIVRDVDLQYRSDILMRTLVASNVSTTVIMETYQGDTVLSTLKFAINAGDSMDSWFGARNLLYSSIDALNHPNQGFQFFSMRGHEDVGRRFFICLQYRGCDNDDGAYAIPTRNNVCAWDREFAFSIITAKDAYVTFGEGNIQPFPGKSFRELRRNNVGDRVIFWLARNAPNDPLQTLPVYATKSLFLTLPFIVRDTSNDGLDAKYPNAFAIDPNDSGATLLHDAMTNCKYFLVDGGPKKLYYHRL